MAQITLITLFKELALLSELGEADAALYAKLDKIMQEMSVVMMSIDECQKTLADKRARVEAWQREELKLKAEFDKLLDENDAHQFSNALIKIYRRKIKSKERRSKRDGEHDDDSSLDSDINSAADSDSDDDEDDNEEADVCPSGCDSAVYDGVLELRNRRLDMEEALGEIQKIVEESKKIHTRLLQKEKTLNKDQTLAEEKIQHFQANKQQKLNQLHRILSLKLSQIKCISVVDEDNVESPGLGQYALLSGQTIRLPESLDEEGQVVFTNTALERLRQRIVDLHREKAEIRRQYRNLKMMYGARMRENKK
ncbi:conserved hypothetical protein, partial [Perkinsus marinus ATCC 50983]